MKALLRSKEVTACWYPNPPCAFLEIGQNISARVFDGAPAYQLTTGEMVTL